MIVTFLFAWAAFLFPFSAVMSATDRSEPALSSPQNVWMDAINTRYILRWDWDLSQANDSVSFTAEYTFSDSEKYATSYTRKCVRVTRRWCNFSNLDYSGRYVLGVWAEVGGQRSDWTTLEFCPDEHAPLGPPSHVKLEPGDAMVTVSFTEPLTEQGMPMSSLLSPMAFTLQYWDKHNLSQKRTKDLQTTQCTLPLEPWTEYCLQVSAYSEGYEKTSPYTQPQCVITLGKRHPPVWQMLLAVFFGCLLLASPVYIHHRKRKTLLSEYTTPSSILGPAVYIQPLLEPVEESSVVEAVEAVLVPLTTPVAVQTEQATKGYPEAGQASASASASSSASTMPGRRGSFRLDSGIYSGEDSGRSIATDAECYHPSV